MAINPIGQYALQGGTFENPIPKEWRDRGYSGAFTVMVELNDAESGRPASPEQIAGLRKGLPYEPYGPDGGYLALAVEMIGNTPNIIMVRRDEVPVEQS